MAEQAYDAPALAKMRAEAAFLKKLPRDMQEKAELFKMWIQPIAMLMARMSGLSPMCCQPSMSISKQHWGSHQGGCQWWQHHERGVQIFVGGVCKVHVLAFVDLFAICGAVGG